MFTLPVTKSVMVAIVSFNPKLSNDLFIESLKKYILGAFLGAGTVLNTKNRRENKLVKTYSYVTLVVNRTDSM